MNGAIDTGSAATLALLADTARAGRGIGYGMTGGEGGGGGMLYPGNSMLAAGAHADGTAVKASIDCGKDQFNAGLNRVSDQAEESRRSAQFTTLVDNVNTNSQRLSDNQFRSELREADLLSAVTREIAQNARATDKNFCDVEKSIADAAKDAAKCCCDAQIAACKSHAEISALVIEQNTATRELIRGDALAAANAKITQLETINALSRCGNQGS